jgi:hypothetical protein
LPLSSVKVKSVESMDTAGGKEGTATRGSTDGKATQVVLWSGREFMGEKPPPLVCLPPATLACHPTASLTLGPPVQPAAAPPASYLATRTPLTQAQPSAQPWAALARLPAAAKQPPVAPTRRAELCPILWRHLDTQQHAAAAVACGRQGAHGEERSRRHSAQTPTWVPRRDTLSCSTRPALPLPSAARRASRGQGCAPAIGQPGSRPAGTRDFFAPRPQTLPPDQKHMVNRTHPYPTTTQHRPPVRR